MGMLYVTFKQRGVNDKLATENVKQREHIYIFSFFPFPFSG